MKKLLIVEDNDIDRESLIRLVGRYDSFDIDIARNVEEAKLKVKGANVIIVDLKLPLRDGAALDQNAGRLVLEQIDEQCVGGHPTVLILSQFKQDDNEVSSYSVNKFPFVKGWFHKADDREALSRFLAAEASS